MRTVFFALIATAITSAVSAHAQNIPQFHIESQDSINITIDTAASEHGGQKMKIEIVKPNGASFFTIIPAAAGSLVRTNKPVTSSGAFEVVRMISLPGAKFEKAVRFRTHFIFANVRGYVIPDCGPNADLCLRKHHVGISPQDADWLYEAVKTVTPYQVTISAQPGLLRHQ